MGSNWDTWGTWQSNQRILVNFSVEADKQNDIHTQKSEEITATNNSGSEHLLKVTIPQFDGNFLKWRQFYDLFSEMVGKQAIPAIQKMWYLKNNFSGEAEHLIS